MATRYIQGESAVLNMTFLTQEGEEATIVGTPTVTIKRFNGSAWVTVVAATPMTHDTGSSYFYVYDTTGKTVGEYKANYAATYDDGTNVRVEEDFIISTQGGGDATLANQVTILAREGVTTDLLSATSIWGGVNEILEKIGGGAVGTYTVSGTITDINGDPVEGVAVTAYVWTDKQTVVATTSSNSSGVFSISLNNGTYWFEFIKSGFIETQKTVVVNGANVVCNV